MLQYFRINDPYRLLGLLALMLVIYLPMFLFGQLTTITELKSLVIGEKIHEGLSPYAELVDSTAPVTTWIYGFLDIIAGRSVLTRHIFGCIVVFSQAVYFGIILIDKKAFTENTFLPSLIFTILFFFSFDTIAFTGELFGAGFLLLALNCLFKEIEFRVQRDETVLNLGLFISLASLCSFAYWLYVLSALAILAFYTRSTARKYMLLAFGFLLPHLFVISIYFLNGNLLALWKHFYAPNLSIPSDGLISAGSLLILGIVPAFFLIVSIVLLNREARFSKYQSQLVQAMFLWLISSLPIAFTAGDLRPQTLIVFIPSLTFFITHFLLLIRRRRFAEISLWLLVSGVISMAYFARFNKLSSINYATMLVNDQANDQSGKKVLSLGSDFSVYKSNELGSGFLNWSVSKQYFQDADDYGNVLMVNQQIQNDPPDVIIDSDNLLRNYLKRIPALQHNYSKSGPATYLRKKS